MIQRNARMAIVTIFGENIFMINTFFES